MKVPMRTLVAVIAGALTMCAATPSSSEAAGGPPPQTKSQRRPPMPCRLPDLVAATLAVELQSTTKGQPGVEFPADRLKVTATVKDAGAMKSPASFTVRLIRGSGAPVASKTLPAPTAAGQTWSLVKEVTWAHDRPASFLFKVESAFDECSNGNNLLAINLDDAQLHATGKQTAADPSLGGTISPGPVVIMF